MGRKRILKHGDEMVDAILEKVDKALWEAINDIEDMEAKCFNFITFGDAKTLVYDMEERVRKFRKLDEKSHLVKGVILVDANKLIINDPPAHPKSFKEYLDDIYRRLDEKG